MRLPLGRLAGVLTAMMAAWVSGCLLDGSAFDAGSTTSSGGGSTGQGAAANTGGDATGATTGVTVSSGGGGTGGIGGGTGAAGGGGTGNTGPAGGGGTGGSDDPECGNRMQEAGEACDDGNDVEGDGCFDCQLDCGCKDCEVGEPCNDCGPNGDGDVTYKDPDSKHCYVFVNSSETWPDARARCVDWGGDLAGLSTQGELATVTAPEIATVFDDDDPNARCWSGGNDRDNEGVYQWSNGEPFTYTVNMSPWSGGEPSGGNTVNCVVIGPGGTLRDRDCMEEFMFLCERAPLNP